jgi:hypothetical protein
MAAAFAVLAPSDHAGFGADSNPDGNGPLPRLS